MAKKYTKLSARYARAFQKAAKEELGSIEACREAGKGLNEFAQLWERELELRLTLLNPSFEKNERLNALTAVCKALNLPEITTRFLRVLCERDRLQLIPEMALAFLELVNKEAGIVQVSVRTARVLEGAERAEIEGELQRLMKGKPEFSWDIDESLLGGMVVEFEGKVIDGSLSGRLGRIEEMLSA